MADVTTLLRLRLILVSGLALATAAGCANHIDSYNESGHYVVLQTVNPPVDTAKDVENYVPRFEELLEYRGFHIGKAAGPRALQLQLVYSTSPSEVRISAYLLQNDTIILRAVASNSRPGDSPDKNEMIAELVSIAVQAFDKQLTEFAPQVEVIPDESKTAAPGTATTVGTAFGTAFATNSGNTYVTARHVVADATRIQLYCGPDRISDATVVSLDQGNDLAVLHSDLKADAFLELAPNDSAHLGDHVFTMGFPTPDLL
ncbi:MAG TPA: serine protease, partial [Gammaproteobacteria bacterium]|nr:serine protease [Gammaproteobacteria bacterium]